MKQLIPQNRAISPRGIRGGYRSEECSNPQLSSRPCQSSPTTNPSSLAIRAGACPFPILSLSPPPFLTRTRASVLMGSYPLTPKVSESHPDDSSNSLPKNAASTGTPQLHMTSLPPSRVITAPQDATLISHHLCITGQAVHHRGGGVRRAGREKSRLIYRIYQTGPFFTMS